MTASYGEYLRRKMEATVKIQSPRPIADASLLTQINRFKNSVMPNQQRQGDGQQVIPSADAYLAAKAGCAVCNAPTQATVTIACCPTPAEDKPLILQGATKCPCAIPGPVELAGPHCC
jgi:hypothetical protein